MDESTRVKKLECPPAGKILDVVIDTDTFNEIDDQYAIAYALNNPERFNVQALYAAPFFCDLIPVMHEKAASPKEGMEKSYNEILNILTLMGREDMKDKVFLGSEAYLPDEKTPVDSPAARDLVAKAMAREDDDPLYVIAIGAIPNVASAILLEPKIIDKIVLVWLGGNAHQWPHNWEFNLQQDVAAARVVFGCGVPLIQLPCSGVVSSFTVSKAELEKYFIGQNALCDYLAGITIKEAAAFGHEEYWTRPIWDVTAVAWLADPKFCPSVLKEAPVPEYDNQYAFPLGRPLMRYVYTINRDALLEDLCKKLTK